MAKESREGKSVVLQFPANFEVLGWVDRFRYCRDEMVRLQTSTPKSGLKPMFQLVLYLLSPGWNVSQTEHALSLVEELFSRELEGKGDEWISPMCQALKRVLLGVYTEEGHFQPEFKTAVEEPYFLPNFVCAVTWLDLPLLRQAMVRARTSGKEEMEDITRWLAILDARWPDDGSCARTKHALDLNRRLVLLECGHEAQALDGYQLPLMLWVGLEKCDLLLLAAMRQHALNHHDKALELIKQAQKAGPRSHELWKYAKLFLLNELRSYLRDGKYFLEAREKEAEFLYQVQKVDLQLQFDESRLDKLKFNFLLHQALLARETNLSRLRNVNLVPELTPNLMLKMDLTMQVSYLYLRGEQLLALDRFDDGIMELNAALCLIPAQGREASWELFNSVGSCCRATISQQFDEQPERRDALLRKLHEQSKDRRSNPRRSFIIWFFGQVLICCNGFGIKLLHDRANEPLEILNSSEDSQDLNVRVYLMTMSALDGMTLYAASLKNLLKYQAYDSPKFLENFPLMTGELYEDTIINNVIHSLDSFSLSYEHVRALKKAYWKAWEACYCSLLSIAKEWARFLRKKNAASQDYYIYTNYSVAYINLHLHCLRHITEGIIHAWPPPPGTISPQDVQPEVYIQGLAQRMWLCAERVRPHFVLSQVFQHSMEPSDDFKEWDMIRQCQKTCGSGTIFLQYISWVKMGDQNVVSVLLPDGFVIHLLLPQSENLENIASEVISAMYKPPDMWIQSEVTDRLEYLYDILMRPVFEKLETFHSAMKPHHKLVISTIGYFSNVPFNLLRNKLTNLYLFEEVTLSMTPSFLLLHQCNKRYEDLQRRPLFGPGPGAAIVLGDPDYRYPHKSLPGSRAEVNAICNLFNTKASGSREMSDFEISNNYQVHKLLRKEATKENLMDWTVNKPTMGGPDGKNMCSQGFIHIAAHACVNAEYPRGVLILTSPNNNPSLSKANESTLHSRNSFRGKEEVCNSSNLDFSKDPDITTSNTTKEEICNLSDLDCSEDSDITTSNIIKEEVCNSNNLDCSEESDVTTSNTIVVKAAEEFCDIVRGPTKVDCDDGYLPSQWIVTSGIEWSAYMVVLSACESGNGLVDDSGTFNLGRAFMAQGIPCSVLSQWPVDDAVTSHLMTLFYTAMRKGLMYH